MIITIFYTAGADDAPFLFFTTKNTTSKIIKRAAPILTPTIAYLVELLIDFELSAGVGAGAGGGGAVQTLLKQFMGDAQAEHAPGCPQLVALFKHAGLHTLLIHLLGEAQAAHEPGCPQLVALLRQGGVHTLFRHKLGPAHAEHAPG